MKVQYSHRPKGKIRDGVVQVVTFQQDAKFVEYRLNVVLEACRANPLKMASF